MVMFPKSGYLRADLTLAFLCDSQVLFALLDDFDILTPFAS